MAEAMTRPAAAIRQATRQTPAPRPVTTAVATAP